jgi:hypothetical protein
MSADGLPMPLFQRKKDTITRDGRTIPGFTPLQAADILAYEQFVAVRRSEIDPDFSIDSLRWAFLELDRHPPGVPGIYEEENIQELERRLAALSRGDIHIL